ncbi:suppressor of tub2 mutation [Malassezia nana]|uniref:Suppressor of tub2 mutation n=1 Tax=Malassezia nana TaxID=180528 RepID=A0AAF0EP37_9BASI|nr:suppressor of tub2 mutation [Malassezia nana]
MDAGRPTELTLVHAIDTANGTPELVEAIDALAASCAETGSVHDMNVALMALHPHIASPHVDVRDATLDALETLLKNGSFTSLSLLTLVRTCVPPILARLHDTPKAEMLLRHMVRIVYHTHVSVHESDAPHTVLERIVRDEGLAATSPQVRAQVLRLLPVLQQDGARWPMRMYLTELADNLQHADAHVREVAKTAVLALLHDAPPALKSELRDELSLRDVHPAVLDEIVRGLGGSKRPLPDELTALPDDVKPVYLLSRYDLDHAFQQAAQALEGKETELNWQPREKAVVAMRGMIRAQVPPDLVAPFLAHVRQVQDGLLKTLASLRTTLSMHTIALIRQLALHYGTLLDPTTMDAFLTALLRMAGFTKKMVATASQLGVSTILACVPMRHAYWQMLQAGLQDKSPATRVHMCKHIQVVLSVHAPSTLEHHGGRDAAATCLTKALCDPHVDVRAAARETFRVFYTLWKEDGERVLMGLPPPTRKQVSASLEQISGPSPRRTPSRAGPSQAILAAKRAALAQSPMPEARRMPRASVWHPNLVGGPDASTDLMEPDSPWRSEQSEVHGPFHGLAGQVETPSHLATPTRSRVAEAATPSDATPVAAPLAAPSTTQTLLERTSHALKTPGSSSSSSLPRPQPPMSAGLARPAAFPTSPSGDDAQQGPSSAPAVPSSSFAFRAPLRPSPVVRKSVVASAALPQTAASWFLARYERCIQELGTEAPSWDEALEPWASPPQAQTQVSSALPLVAQALDTPPSAEQRRTVLEIMGALETEDGDDDAWLWSLIVLYRLAPHISDTPEEGAWLALALRSVHADMAHRTLAMGAGRAMMDAWLAQKHEAVQACAALLQALGAPETLEALPLALALYTMEQLVSRMPMVHPSAELGAMVPIVHRGLRHHHTPVRRASVAVLVQAHLRWIEVHRDEAPTQSEAALHSVWSPLRPSEEQLVQVRSLD